MRKIERQMIQAIQENKDLKVANTEVISCSHVSDVYLHGNLIARIGETWMELFDGGWQTNTTKSRLNALLQAFGMASETLARIYGKECVVVALHGVNPVIKDFSARQGFRLLEIFDQGIEGLNLYEQCSLHFGFRVHAHVSALARAKPSYLLEIDGRGSSYAMTIPVSCSRQCYRLWEPSKSTSSITKRAIAKARRTLRVIGMPTASNMNASSALAQAPTSSVQQLVALLNADIKEGFSRFRPMKDYLAQLQHRFESVSADLDSSLKGL